ncbi:MAG: RNA-binding protein [Candidatus Magasanikbacteria bacterium]|jgi:RNA recognition motif-containing protein|nr:RNA-binding protein [Candidatus Magasanikbacteria bacterium]MBT4221298.1 RNA-binding protein [Candidatus Magasanikbacteria bacterium]MBT4350444.1 RNA-binding protein [Candidatus Magasanikbacteria bacterium]MBT4542009.1 RNA-binding protein [Candidatus Magasanikbacteria bacterium]MBT6253422.1 RNA-binding protein [Candidatus Magasanikbacteria bacterium]
MKNKLFVGSLPYAVTDQDLASLFAAHGEVVSAKVIIDTMSNRSKGFGFVEMATDEQAQAAIEALHESDMMGRNIMVNVARPKA